MKLRFLTIPLLAFAIGFSGCDDDDDGITVTPTTFTVTVENVSTAGTIATDRAMGTNPLSPPAWAVFDGDDPMFEVGDKATVGTARIAEDGFPDEMLIQLNDDDDVSASGAATSPGGPDNGPAVFAGETATFSFTAVPGDKLQFETMFVQSNDWFYAFNNEGLELFDGGAPVTGDVTGRIAVYDAGTEQDTAPGTGPDQKPVQDGMATNVGPDEDVDIENARTRHPSFTIPANSAVIQVTISAN